MANIVKANNNNLELDMGGAPFIVLSCVPAQEYDRATNQAIPGSQRKDDNGLLLWTVSASSTNKEPGERHRAEDEFNITIHSASDPCGGGSGVFFGVEGFELNAYSRSVNGSRVPSYSFHGTGLVGFAPYSDATAMARAFAAYAKRTGQVEK